MLEIDYTGLFIDGNINKFLNDRSYDENIKLYNMIYDYYKDYKLKEFNQNEIIDLKILLWISIKYKFGYEKTKSIIVSKTNDLIQARFHLGGLLIKLLKTKEEKEQWLDASIDYYLKQNTDFSLRSLCNFLEDINDFEKVDKNKYKEIYPDTCIKQADKNTGITASHWYQLALPVYKELGAKEKYEKALVKYNNNIKVVQSEMKTHEFILKNEKLQKEIFNHEQIIKNFFKTGLKNAKEIFNYLCNFLIFKNFGDNTYQYSPIYIPSKKKKITSSLVDQCSITTLNGYKIIKSHDLDFKMELWGRDNFRLITLTPAIEGVIENKIDKNLIIKELLSSKIIFTEDKKHINKALKLFFAKDFDTFIYIITPNLEKLLRNILIINNIPYYKNKDTEPAFHVTLTLTDTLKIIKEKKLLFPELVTKISQLLNEEDYENYRNKLCHRDDESIFTNIVAYDLFLLLIQIINSNENNEINTFVITKQ